MNQTESLKTWMTQNGYTNTSLAVKLGYTYEAVYAITSRSNRPINDKFRWRFAQVFGWELANKLFGQPQEPEYA